MTHSFRRRSVLTALIVGLFLSLGASVSHSNQPQNFILALDVSDSMKGEGISAISSAAISMVNRLPDSAQLEIYTFARTLQLVQSVTGDRSILNARLRSIQGQGGTAIYDAISNIAPRAVKLNAPIIVFTDGRDSRSSLGLDSLITQIQQVGLHIDFVSYQLREEERRNLNAISSVGGGAVFSADDVEGLVKAFSLALVSAQAGATEGKTNLSKSPLALIAGGTALLSFLALISLNEMRRRRNYLRNWDELLDKYEISSPQLEVAQTSTGRSTFIKYVLDRLIGNTELIFPDPSQKRARQFGMAVVGLAFTSLLTALGNSLFASLLIAGIILLVALRWYVAHYERNMYRNFELDLPSSLKLISASLSSGMSFLQALETFSQENRSEVARQFRRALSEIQMGVPVEKALDGVAKRMKSKDLEWAVFAYTIQREVGGSLATVLKTTAETIESRAELRREVRTLSAEGRLSSYILMALPILIFLFLLAVRPTFIAVFWKEEIGHLMVFAVVVCLSAAWLWMRRLIRIEV